LLTIIKAFKHWQHYLKNSCYLIEIFMNYNNLQEFINVKSLNRRQAHWVMKLAAYDFYNYTLIKENKSHQCIIEMLWLQSQEEHK